MCKILNIYCDFNNFIILIEFCYVYNEVYFTKLPNM